MRRNTVLLLCLCAFAVAACGTTAATPTPKPAATSPSPSPHPKNQGLGDTSTNPDTHYACAYQGLGSLITVAGTSKSGTDTFCNIYASTTDFAYAANISTPAQSSCYSTLSDQTATLRIYQAPDGSNEQTATICGALLAPPSATAQPNASPAAATISVVPSSASVGQTLQITLAGLTPTTSGKIEICYMSADLRLGACDRSSPGVADGAKSYPVSSAGGHSRWRTPSPRPRPHSLQLRPRATMSFCSIRN